jgi:peptide/nickel transport system ATP-binding protein
MSLLALDKVDFAYDAARPVLHGVSLSVAPRESLGIVGESGSGKSTILKLLLGLERPVLGEVRFRDRPLALKDRALMRGFRREVQAVFQDPYGSLDPRQNVFAIIAEPLRSLGIAGDHRAMAAAALVSVGLEPDMLTRYPHEFSGGQRQRIAIARAIVPGPSLLIADEAVSALDLSTRVHIVDLLKKLATDMALVFVSHDIGVVGALCDRIAIVERGRIVEQGPTRQVLATPQHPYTQALLASVPRMPA